MCEWYGSVKGRRRWITSDQASTANSQKRQISPQKRGEEKRQETASQSLCWRRCGGLSLIYMALLLKYTHLQFMLHLQGNTCDRKRKKKSERATAGSVTGRRIRRGETGSGKNAENKPELIHEESGQHLIVKIQCWTRPQRGTCCITVDSFDRFITQIQLQTTMWRSF